VGHITARLLQRRFRFNASDELLVTDESGEDAVLFASDAASTGKHLLQFFNFVAISGAVASSGPV